MWWRKQEKIWPLAQIWNSCTIWTMVRAEWCCTHVITLGIQTKERTHAWLQKRWRFCIFSQFVSWQMGVGSVLPLLPSFGSLATFWKTSLEEKTFWQHLLKENWIFLLVIKKMTILCAFRDILSWSQVFGHQEIYPASKLATINLVLKLPCIGLILLFCFMPCYQ